MLYRSDIVWEVILADLDAYKCSVQRELSVALDQVRGTINRIAASEDRLAPIEGFVSNTACAQRRESVEKNYDNQEDCQRFSCIDGHRPSPIY